MRLASLAHQARNHHHTHTHRDNAPDTQAATSALFLVEQLGKWCRILLRLGVNIHISSHDFRANKVKPTFRLADMDYY